MRLRQVVAAAAAIATVAAISHGNARSTMRRKRVGLARSITAIGGLLASYSSP